MAIIKRYIIYLFNTPRYGFPVPAIDAAMRKSQSTRSNRRDVDRMPVARDGGCGTARCVEHAKTGGADTCGRSGSNIAATKQRETRVSRLGGSDLVEGRSEGWRSHRISVATKCLRFLRLLISALKLFGSLVTALVLAVVAHHMRNAQPIVRKHPTPPLGLSR